MSEIEMLILALKGAKYNAIECFGTLSDSFEDFDKCVCDGLTDTISETENLLKALKEVQEVNRKYRAKTSVVVFE